MSPTLLHQRGAHRPGCCLSCCSVIARLARGAHGATFTLLATVCHSAFVVPRRREWVLVQFVCADSLATLACACPDSLAVPTAHLRSPLQLHYLWFQRMRDQPGVLLSCFVTPPPLRRYNTLAAYRSTVQVLTCSSDGPACLLLASPFVDRGCAR